MLHAFFYGLILAIGLIVPLGVQNIFIFNQGASQKRLWHAFPSVITAACCDALLILGAVLGVSLIVFKIPLLKLVIFVVGFFFLLYMSWMTWNARSNHSHGEQKPLSAKKQVGFSLSVSLLNPHAIIDSVGVIGTNALSFTGNARWAYTAACILASCIWFTTLAITGRFVQRLDKTGGISIFVNKLSALIIFGVAMYIAYQIKLILM